MFKVWISWVSVKDMKNYSIKYLGSREALEKRRLHHIQKGLCPVAAILSPTSSLSSLTRDKIDIQLIVTDKVGQDVDKLEYQKPAYVAVGLVMAVTLFVVLFPLLVTSQVLGMLDSVYDSSDPTVCDNQCVYTLVESIPENLTYGEGSPTHPTTYSAWKTLLSMATETIDIGSFYWSLKSGDIYKDPSDWEGDDIYSDIVNAAKIRGIKIRIAQNQPDDNNPNNDTMELSKAGLAEVRSLNFTRWFGAGILHSKLWIIDGKHFYVGSANMDWRSLTQVKEMGAVVYNCSCLTADMSKLFAVYWEMGKPGAKIPSEWDHNLATTYNKDEPMKLDLNSTNSHAYISSSPPPFCPSGRTTDIDAIVDIINKAQKYVYIAVMDYFPATIYKRKNQFWPVIDDALRKAAFERKVEVRLLASHWKHTRPDMFYYLKSLAELSGAVGHRISVKLFQVPAFTDAQKKIPFARVNHNKYMVTDNVAYIGTSNWSADYFISTGGIGLIINQTLAAINSSNHTPFNSTSSTSESTNNSTTNTFIIQQQLTNVFLRDWNSKYAHSVWDVTYDKRRGRHSSDSNRVNKEEL